MFDYVICETPLPDGWQPDELQSKDLDCAMTNVRISAEGRLLIERYESYDVPKEERPYPDAPKGSFKSLCGIWGKRNRRWEDLNYHGDFNFYGGGFKNDWHEYYARFTEGQLTGIRAVHDAASGTLTEGGDVKQAPGESLSGPVAKPDAQTEASE